MSRIIVIDDLEINRRSAITLVEAGHEVIVFGTVDDAVEYLRYCDLVPDLVLTDLWMPAPVPRSAGGDQVTVNRVLYSKDKDDHYSDMIPAGLIIAICAKNLGIERIGILTDTNHHRDQVTALCESFGHVPKLVWQEALRGEEGREFEQKWARKDDAKNFRARSTISIYDFPFKNPDGSKDWLSLAKFLLDGVAP